MNERRMHWHRFVTIYHFRCMSRRASLKLFANWKRRKRKQSMASYLNWLLLQNSRLTFLFLLPFSDSDERFEYARKLKLCMSALRSAGERLGRYSLAKRQAVQQEDFIAAKLRKEQMEMYKKSVFEQLQVNVLLEPNGLCAANDTVSNLYAQKPSLPSPPSLQDVAVSLTNESTSFATAIHSPKSLHCDTAVIEARSPKQSPLLNQIGMSPKRGSPNTGSLRRRNKSAPRTSYDDYDERAVPALRQ